MSPRSEYETLGHYAAKENELFRKLRNGEISWTELEPWMQNAIEGKFNRLPRNHPLPLTPFLPPQAQWWRAVQLAETLHWPFERSDFIKISPPGEWGREKQDPLVQWILMVYFDDPVQTFKVWWGLLKQNWYWCRAKFDYKHGLEIDAGHLRIRPGVEVPRNSVRWEKIDLGANWVTGYDPRWNYDSVKSANWQQSGSPTLSVHAQVLAAALYNPAWVSSLEGRRLPGNCYMPGFQVRSGKPGSDWDHTLSIRYDETMGGLEINASSEATRYPGDQIVPKVLEVVDCTKQD